jgi:hypothetical protein
MAVLILKKRELKKGKKKSSLFSANTNRLPGRKTP